MCAPLELDDSRIIVLDAEGGRAVSSPEGRELIASELARLIAWCIDNSIPFGEVLS